MSNVKLAIRVRPFTERESKSEKVCTPVVNVIDQNTVTITNVKVSLSGAGDSRERVRRYFADYTFDSACGVTNSSYASQEKVFESIGREVLSSVLSGSATCVLAYGQSSTGKTYTMMGTDAQPGLVPRICQALVGEQPIQISVSFLEIYNERVHDLLAGDAVVTCHSLPRRRGNSRKDLRVREHPTRGPYVQNLRRVAVHDLHTLLSLVAEGARRRQTAATKRNSTSSRSHALLELSTAKATLHLADLAGSEKASWEGCGGGRQKEGANINKSLVALSNVISALVSGGGNKGRFVPYRDSALTWLLKDCFTGGARTFIITTLSPSVSCYGESASTLRWAARARQLPTQKIPTWSTQPSRAALQSQYDQLIRELNNNFIHYVQETGKLVYDDSHWALNKHILKTESKIGNIMNILNPSADAPQSESTASSVASGSSDVINTMDKNIKSEINKEVDKIFGPALERTKSDIEISAPLRHKRRQYKSQEVLSIDKTLHALANSTSTENQTKVETNAAESNTKVAPNIPIFYDNNQRAEIVASVTERLYTKLKKKEEAAVSKIESTVDRKIMEPLSELRICTNARQRLMELSHKALRNKRRIGIPAHTQTRKYVIRVKNQGVDTQTDLESYIMRKGKYNTLIRDVATETVPMTPRCKEIAAGPKFGSLYFCDKATITESKPKAIRHSSMITDKIERNDRSTQTQIVPPPRRKRTSNFNGNISNDNDHDKNESSRLTPFISINISQPYTADTDSQSSEDENYNQENVYSLSNKPLNIQMPPDLLTNHNTVDTSGREEEESDRNSDTESKLSEIINLPNPNEPVTTAEHVEFPHDEECCFPRVTVNTSIKDGKDEMKNIILGRNDNLFPYNIVLSPPRIKDSSKRIVQFRESTNSPNATLLTECNCENSDSSHKSTTSSEITSGADNVGSKISPIEPCKERQENELTDTTDSSKIDTNSFIWNTAINPYNKTNLTTSQKLNFNIGLKTRPRYMSNKTKMYREFLGLEPNADKNDTDKELPPYYSLSDVTKDTSCDSTDIEQSQDKFRQNRRFFEDKLNRSALDRSEAFDRLEKSILDSCNSLDRSVNKYEDYLLRFRRNSGYVFNQPTVRTPTQYMQHLVQLRREVVKRDCDSTDSSFK